VSADEGNGVRYSIQLVGEQVAGVAEDIAEIKIDVKDLAASLALPSNNNSEELRFRQTSSRV